MDWQPLPQPALVSGFEASTIGGHLITVKFFEPVTVEKAKAQIKTIFPQDHGIFTRMIFGVDK
jgi:hypothetical protein